MNRHQFHPADFAELKRMINNLIRQGTIYAVNSDRVQVLSNKLITGWLPWMTHRAGNAKTWWQPSVGEQVLILSPNGNLELGCVLPSLYCDDFAPPTTDPNQYMVEFPDGATFVYDSSASTLTIKNIKQAVIEAETEITAKSMQINLDAPLVECSGHVNMASFSAGAGARSARSGAIGSITGSLEQTGGSLSSNGVVLETHKHGETGKGQTTEPIK